MSSDKFCSHHPPPEKLAMLRSTRSACLILTVLILSSAVSAGPPNVVVILGDDQAWTDYGFMGHPEIKTPHLDRLASQSACFTQGYGPTSLCRASLASIITGLYPHQHQIVGNDPPKGTDRAEMLRHIRRAPTLPKYLGEKGYVSFQSGKWWEGSPAEGGFTAFMSHGDPAKGGRHGDVGLKIGRDGMQPVFDFIDGTKGKPFFLWYAPLLPHSPHNPPQRLLAKYTRDGKPLPIAKYEAMCEWFDETCGQLLDHLDQKHLDQETIVVFLADNGWIQKPDSDQFAPKSKRSPYDGGLRTPILIRWPGHLAPQRIETPVSSIDIVPTILAAVGFTPNESLPGIDLAQVARGKSDRTTLFGSTFDHDVADIDRPEASLQYRWCREHQWKLILPQDAASRPELYDLSKDPHEESNLSASNPDVVDRLTKKIDAWWSVPKKVN